jgi:para-aminobenzoate synthetase / 4-amino-4-deoxychorismate lyase
MRDRGLQQSRTTGHPAPQGCAILKTDTPKLLNNRANNVAQASESAGFVALREEGRWRIYTEPIEILMADDPESLDSLLRRIDSHVSDGGEAAGFLTYEAGIALEPRLRPLLPAPATTLAWFGLYDRCEVMNGEEFLRVCTEPSLQGPHLAISREEYCGKVKEIRELIADGEIYQINFTDRLKFGFSGRPWGLFATLCAEHPTPYPAFVNTGIEQVLSHSPELFFRIQGRRIVVQPMKGTAPRGLTATQDRQRAMELQQSEKERAENVMIVDLMRSDLGRICTTGSVQTTKLFEATRFSSLWQMTSTIEGELLNDWTIGSVMRALFPSGSVTGAPKIRAMEHIARLESARRGIYTGAIGFVAKDSTQFSVAIRTSVLRAGEGAMGVGSGITYDSVPEREWEECAWKCGFLTRRAPRFKLFETILWHEAYVLLERHVARMASSAEYFGFEFDRLEVDAQLCAAASQFAPGEKWRVKISLDRKSHVEVASARVSDERNGRVMIAERRTFSEDYFLFHKTTHRPIYDQALADARAAECDDALFFNEHDELTEGAIHNVFLVKNGVWLTPAERSGLLPGTYRAEFLAEHPGAREEILRREDLFQADAIFLCNSVRGMYEVKLVEQAR